METGEVEEERRRTNSAISRSSYPFNLESISSNLLSAASNLSLISLPICCMVTGLLERKDSKTFFKKDLALTTPKFLYSP